MDPYEREIYERRIEILQNRLDEALEKLANATELLKHISDMVDDKPKKKK